MMYLFLGQDHLAKQQAIQRLAAAQKTEATTFAADNVPPLAELTEATLFGGPRLFVIHNSINNFDVDTDIPVLVRSPHTIIFAEDTLDKRKKTTAALLKHPDITVQEFPVPDLAHLPQWVMQQAQSLRVKIDSAAIDYFLRIALPESSANRFAAPAINVWQLYNELQKLATYTQGQPVTRDAIDAVIIPNNSAEVWDIINALADRNIKQAFIAMEKFFATAGSDDKTKAIQLNALLSDQFRNILLAQDLLNRQISEEMAVQQTGWKSGRWYVMKKLAGKFRPAQLLVTLDKLERLDFELKTSNIPGQTILQLITAQI